jgi:hypothetical protein
MDIKQQRTAAESFAMKWAGRGYEKGDTAPFWIEFLRECLGVTDPDSIARFEKRTDAGFPDVTIFDAGIIIEQKSIGINLDKPELRQNRQVTPYGQALSYAQSLPPSQQPRFIITSNFQTFRLYDRELDQSGETFTQVELEELPEQIHLFNFIIDPKNSRIERERKVSIEAGALIGELHHELLGEYIDPESATSQHSLNVLCVRLVFLLFAEDSGIFGRKNILLEYLMDYSADQTRKALVDLFEVLNTPEDLRDPYLPEKLKAFPYVNGGLFKEVVEIPNFTNDIRYLLLFKLSQQTDWSGISPTVFGSVFESTLNPDTRTSGGMHYTSVENIHKVIDPLFLDKLTEELDDILASGVSEKTMIQKLRDYQDKLSGLSFLDPACGSGNFLTETYICLRRLENRSLMYLQVGQSVFGFAGITDIKVSLAQFSGIEINDFAVRVANTALWIAELQANIESETVIQRGIQDLPLSDSVNIVLANALRIDWNEVLPAEKCSYVMGNPPFQGARVMNNQQKQEIVAAFDGAKNAGNIDYVAGWYMKAAKYINGSEVECAFVSTNSICQGEQVANIWEPIKRLGVSISFAHRTFRWTNKADRIAHVFVVIVGFSQVKKQQLVLYSYETPDSLPTLSKPNNINTYLIDAPDVFIYNRSEPISDVPEMRIGNKPIDDGNYLFSVEEKAWFLQREPAADKFFHPWLGSDEFINNKERYVLWLGNATAKDLKKMPLSRERIRKVRNFRLASNSAPTQKLADKPMHFHVESMPEVKSLLIPRHSSERRKYIPIGFINPNTFAGDSNLLIPNATLYHFGILTSLFHNAWMRVVAGRLKSDYRYSAGVVYNNFIWPNPTDAQKAAIEELAQIILDTRSNYSDSTLAEMYDPDNDYLFSDLIAAHKALDKAVEQAYGVDFNGNEEKIVTFLFNLYSELTAEM